MTREKMFSPAPRHFRSLVPLAPPASEGASYNKFRPCATFSGAFLCGSEWDEWVLVSALVSPRSVVIEFGARFGTTSCNLAAATHNSGLVVSVEPDPRAHRHLLHNRDLHHCNFAAVLGTVSAIPLRMGALRRGQYHQKTLPATNASLPNFDFQHIEAQIGAKFDTALIDCEGCFDFIPLALIRQLKLILLEEDAVNSLISARWRQKLRTFGFRRVWNAHDTYNMPGNNFSKWMMHSAWLHNTSTAASPTSCLEYSVRMNYSRDKLWCVPHQVV